MQKAPVSQTEAADGGACQLIIQRWDGSAAELEQVIVVATSSFLPGVQDRKVELESSRCGTSGCPSSDE